MSARRSALGVGNHSCHWGRVACRLGGLAVGRLGLEPGPMWAQRVYVGTPPSASRSSLTLRPAVRRSSTSTAAAAFAIATSASSNPRDLSPAMSGMSRASCSSASGLGPGFGPGFGPNQPGGLTPGLAKERRRKESVLSTAATMRVLNVLRHWVSKHSQVRRTVAVGCVESDSCRFDFSARGWFTPSPSHPLSLGSGLRLSQWSPTPPLARLRLLPRPRRPEATRRSQASQGQLSL